MSSIDPHPAPHILRLQQLADLMDNKFRIPGTNFRFGLDPILGLVPYAGDLASLLVSGLLVRTMAKKGAGPGIILQMMGNIALDALVGLVPFVGDLFDFGFKANRRNLSLLKKYYADGQPRPDARWSLALVTGLILVLLGAIFWLAFKCAAWLIHLTIGLFT